VNCGTVFIGEAQVGEGVHISAQIIFIINLNTTPNMKNAKEINMDSITTEVTHVQDWNGGSLHRIGGVDMVVLNGTYKEMGRRTGISPRTR